MHRTQRELADPRGGRTAAKYPCVANNKDKGIWINRIVFQYENAVTALQTTILGRILQIAATYLKLFRYQLWYQLG